MRVNTINDSLLGREVAYPSQYQPDLLFPIPRAQARAQLGLRNDALPFHGHDRWHGYELGWLDANGKPKMATATFHVPFDSPNLIESKSFKLYLNSLNAHRLPDQAALLALLRNDLSASAGAPVAVELGLPPLDTTDTAVNLDDQQISIDSYGPPDASLLQADAGRPVAEVLRSDLLKSNCPVTGQPDWATVSVQYRGPAIDHAGLLRYLVSFRDHAEFHEQCVERIFVDVMARCAPRSLSVEARYTRRGGLDINPWRATIDMPVPQALRDARQ